MTKEDFFKKFKRELDVADPKRQEIISELETHFEENDHTEDAQAALGDPVRLARQYNRVHVGFFFSPFRFFGAPVVLVLLMTIASLTLPSDASVYLGNVEGVFYYLYRLAMIIAPLTLSIALGRTLGKKHNRAFHWLLLVAETFVLGCVYFGATMHYSTAMDVPAVFFGAFIFTVVGMILTFWALVMSTPINQTKNEKIIGARFYLEMVLMIFFIIFSFFISMGVTGTVFVPFDVALVRPPETAVISQINNFFESGFGIFIPTMILELGLLALLVNRILKYQKIKNQDALVWGIALVCGIGIACIDYLRQQTSLTFFLLAIAGFSLSMIKANRVWRWGIALGATIPIVEFILVFIWQWQGRSTSYIGVVAILSVLPALGGSYLGFAIREAIKSKKKISV